jgi:hypothetical protein
MIPGINDLALGVYSEALGGNFIGVAANGFTGELTPASGEGGASAVFGVTCAHTAPIIGSKMGIAIPPASTIQSNLISSETPWHVAGFIWARPPSFVVEVLGMRVQSPCRRQGPQWFQLTVDRPGFCLPVNHCTLA